MDKWLVERPKDNVIVTIMKHKIDGMYSFVNLTKGHICPCKFSSIEEGLHDMDKQIDEGLVLRYTKLEV
jgi:hypothetical protein